MRCLPVNQRMHGVRESGCAAHLGSASPRSGSRHQSVTAKEASNSSLTVIYINFSLLLAHICFHKAIQSLHLPLLCCTFITRGTDSTGPMASPDHEPQQFEDAQASRLTSATL